MSDAISSVDKHDTGQSKQNDMISPHERHENTEDDVGNFDGDNDLYNGSNPVVDNSYSGQSEQNEQKVSPGKR